MAPAFLLREYDRVLMQTRSEASSELFDGFKTVHFLYRALSRKEVIVCFGE